MVSIRHVNRLWMLTRIGVKAWPCECTYISRLGKTGGSIITPMWVKWGCRLTTTSGSRKKRIFSREGTPEQTPGCGVVMPRYSGVPMASSWGNQSGMRGLAVIRNLSWIDSIFLVLTIAVRRIILIWSVASLRKMNLGWENEWATRFHHQC